jgi:hypothetical protein
VYNSFIRSEALSPLKVKGEIKMSIQESKAFVESRKEQKETELDKEISFKLGRLSDLVARQERDSKAAHLYQQSIDTILAWFQDHDISVAFDEGCYNIVNDEEVVQEVTANDPNRTETIEVVKLSNKKIPTGYTLKLVYREGTSSNTPWHVKAFYNGQEIAHESTVLKAKRAIGKHVRANAEPIVMPYGFRVLVPGDGKYYPMSRGKCIFSKKTGEAVSFKTKQAAENYIIREAKKIA